MTVDDLLAVKSVSDPQVSPDGTLVVYVVSEIDRETGKSNSDLWLVPVAGGEPKRLTTSNAADSHPRWSPDGTKIAFGSTRSGSSQIWILPIDGGEAAQLTKLPIDLAEPIWSPTGTHLAAVGRVYPGLTPKETASKDEEKAGEKSSAQVYDQLMVRHWSTWDDHKRSHPFVIDASTGEAKDLTLDLTANVPPFPFGGSSDYCFSPDGKFLAFTAEPLLNHPWSTNTDIWLGPIDASKPPINLTEAHLGADAQPSFAPDGSMLVFVRQERAAFEADQWILHAARRTDDGIEKPIPLAAGIDRPVGSYAWDGNTTDLLAVIDDQGMTSVVQIPTLKRIQPRVLIEGIGTVNSVSRAGEGGIVFGRSRADQPVELIVQSSEGELTQLTAHNAALVEELDLNPAESFTFEGADGDEVQGFLIRPPGFDPSQKYPVLFLIHGGPQGAWHDSWHPRWNLGLFASPGYAVVAINPRGSTGFGQEFTDQISTDWGGRVYVDLMKGLDHALANYPFLDEARMAAAGGSYGGYMVNWIAGHTDRFKALISHAGLFDLLGFYYATEELWFPEWEFGGPPWNDPELYRKLSPSTYADQFSTPTLVIHGALDFRVPDAQGLGMFTALQRQGVPSRYVFYPDEGHWIAKTANRVSWWNEFHGWLERYLGDSPEDPTTSDADES